MNIPRVYLCIDITFHQLYSPLPKKQGLWRRESGWNNRYTVHMKISHEKFLIADQIWGNIPKYESDHNILSTYILLPVDTKCENIEDYSE